MNDIARLEITAARAAENSEDTTAIQEQLDTLYQAKDNELAAMQALFNDDDMREVVEEKHSLYKWAFALTDKQRDTLCDMGYYNDTMKGYLIAACRLAKELEPNDAADSVDLTEGQIKTLLSALEWSLSEYNKHEAEELYRKR